MPIIGRQTTYNPNQRQDLNLAIAQGISGFGQNLANIYADYKQREQGKKDNLLSGLFQKALNQNNWDMAISTGSDYFGEDITDYITPLATFEDDKKKRAKSAMLGIVNAPNKATMLINAMNAEIDYGIPYTQSKQLFNIAQDQKTITSAKLYLEKQKGQMISICKQHIDNIQKDPDLSEEQKIEFSNYYKETIEGTGSYFDNAGYLLDTYSSSGNLKKGVELLGGPGVIRDFMKDMQYRYKLLLGKATIVDGLDAARRGGWKEPLEQVEQKMRLTEEKIKTQKTLQEKYKGSYDKTKEGIKSWDRMKLLAQYEKKTKDKALLRQKDADPKAFAKLAEDNPLAGSLAMTLNNIVNKKEKISPEDKKGLIEIIDAQLGIMEQEMKARGILKEAPGKKGPPDKQTQELTPQQQQIISMWNGMPEEIKKTFWDKLTPEEEEDLKQLGINYGQLR